MWGKLKLMSVWLVYNSSRYFFSRNPLSSYSIYFAILKLSFAPFQRMHVRQETWMVIYSIYSPWSCYERGVRPSRRGRLWLSEEDHKAANFSSASDSAIMCSGQKDRLLCIFLGHDIRPITQNKYQK